MRKTRIRVGGNIISSDRNCSESLTRFDEEKYIYGVML